MPLCAPPMGRTEKTVPVQNKRISRAISRVGRYLPWREPGNPEPPGFAMASISAPT